MNAQALPSTNSTWRERAVAAIAAWSAWRARKLKPETMLEASAFAAMLTSWALAYVLACPPTPVQHHRAHSTVMVLR